MSQTHQHLPPLCAWMYGELEDHCPSYPILWKPHWCSHQTTQMHCPPPSLCHAITLQEYGVQGRWEGWGWVCQVCWARGSVIVQPLRMAHNQRCMFNMCTIVTWWTQWIPICNSPGTQVNVPFYCFSYQPSPTFPMPQLIPTLSSTEHSDLLQPAMHPNWLCSPLPQDERRCCQRTKLEMAFCKHLTLLLVFWDLLWWTSSTSFTGSHPHL